MQETVLRPSEQEAVPCNEHVTKAGITQSNFFLGFLMVLQKYSVLKKPTCWSNKPTRWSNKPTRCSNRVAKAAFAIWT